MSLGPSDDSVARWHRQLRHFRFYRARGGHANDGDSLHCVLPCANEAGLLALMARLDFALTVIPDGAPRIEVGVSYNSVEWDRRYYPIRAHPRYVQPGFTRLLGLPAYLSVHGNGVLVGVAGAEGNPWEVTEADFQNALIFEAEFTRRGVVPV